MGLQAFPDQPLVAFGLDHVRLEGTAKALVTGQLRRRVHLRQRLLLDRVGVGQVLDQLLGGRG
jgi:hypothetical protein